MSQYANCVSIVHQLTYIRHLLVVSRSKIWNAAYDEEYEGLRGLDMFIEITYQEYCEYI